MSKNVVFMGSPEIAVTILETLASNYSVVGVVTQPNRPAGRGRVLTPPPVKRLADRLGIPTIQPERLKDAGVFEQLLTWNPDVIVVAAFGQILRQKVLELPRFGCINMHASFLPRWRGAAPIQAAILNGDSYTGVSIMKMDAGIDTGPVLLQQKIRIEPDETNSTLSVKLAHLGARLLIDALEPYLAGKLQPTPQPAEGDTYAPMLQKEQGRLDFHQSVLEIDRKVRAFNDWPGTFFDYKGQTIKVRKIQIFTCEPHPAEQHGIFGKEPAISTPDGWVQFLEVQPAGKKWMTGAEFLRGVSNWMTPDNHA